MDNIGRELTPEVVDALISDNFGVNCFLLLGEGNDQKAFLDLARYVKSAHKDLALAIYSGRVEVEDEFYSLFDYVKVGPYLPSKGPLNNRNTNQRLYHIVNGRKMDITSRFWHHGIDPNVK
jgi:anaerobic ribonucleoside-triphosphate reductase activating protein